MSDNYSTTNDLLNDSLAGADLTVVPARRLVGLMRAREVSPVEVARAYVERIEGFNPQINAVVQMAEDWREQAARAERLLVQDDATSASALCGLPLTVKDTIDVEGFATTAGSIMRRNLIAREDAPLVRRLRQAGAIIIGKTNTAELALDYESDNPLFGRTNNPHDLTRSPGGSSGGEAAAQTARFSAAGLGSDMVGSLRVPAHCCGVTSLKSTTEKFPAAGHFPASTGAISLSSTIGFIARTTDDLALLFEVATGTTITASQDSAAIEKGKSKERRAASTDLIARRVAYSSGECVGISVSTEVAAAIERAAEACRRAGAQVSKEFPSAFERGARLWGELFGRAVAPQVFEAYAGNVHGAAGASAREMIDREKRLPPFDEMAWLEAKNERDYLRASVLRWFADIPVLIAPVGSTSAHRHGERKVTFKDAVTNRTQTISLFRAYSFTHVANVFDLPVVTVPVRLGNEGLPIAVQVIGAPGSERLLLEVARVIEESCGGYRAPRML